MNRKFVYRIDAVDVITDVDDSWVEFAQRNEAESLTRTAVVGSSLWSHVSGDEVRHVYERLFEHVRSGREITVPFRCDSPALRRFLEMQMIPLKDGGIALECRLLREEPRTSRATTLLEPGGPRGEELLVMCSWCKKIESLDSWLELDRAVEAMDLLSRPLLPNISHSICPSCKEALDAHLQAAAKQRLRVGIETTRSVNSTGS